MRHYRLEFTIPETKLQTIMGALAGEVENLSITQVAKANGSAAPRSTFAMTAPSVRLIADALSRFKVGETFKIEAVSGALVKGKYNAKSASPILSGLKAQGYIKQLRRGGPFEILKLVPKPEL